MAGDLLFSQEGFCCMELVSTKVQDRNLKPGPNSPRDSVFMQTKKNVPCYLCVSICVSQFVRQWKLSPACFIVRCSRKFLNLEVYS